MIQITVEGRRASASNKELLTSGSAGIEAQFTLDEAWELAPARTAVFRVGDDGNKYDVPLDNTLTCVVPPECLTVSDEVLFIGIYGGNGSGTIIIPTIWVSAGVIKPGTEPNTPREYQPTPSVVEQIHIIANRAEQTATDAMTLVEERLSDLSALESTVQGNEEQRQQNETQREADFNALMQSARAYVLEPSVSAIVYDPNAESGEKISPDYLSINAYYIDNEGDRGGFVAPNFEVSIIPESGTPTTTSWTNTTGVSLELPQTITSGTTVQARIWKDNSLGLPMTLAEITIPIVSHGKQGLQGNPGVSPTVTVETITDGHRVTITDESHPAGQSFDVLDGASDAGRVTYDETATYQAGSVGAELSDLTRHLNDIAADTVDIDFTTVSPIIGAINASNVWSKTVGFTSYAFNVNARFKRLSITASANATAIIGLLKNSNLVNGQIPPFCEGIGERIVLNAGETQVISIPDDCTYIVITNTTSDSVDHTPAYGQFGILKNIPTIDSTLTVSGDAADARAVGEAISLHDNLFDSADPTVLSLFIRATNNTFKTTSDNRLVVIAVNRNTDYYIKCGGTSTKRVGFSNDFPSNGTAVTIVGNDIPGEVDILANSGNNTYLSIQLYIDSDDDRTASHYYAGIMVEQKNVVNYLDNKIDALTDGIPLGLHEMPENNGVLNVIKRCRQLTDIEWTPAVDLPRFMRVWRGWGADVPSTAVPEDHTGTFKAGVTYKGIPYGRPKASISSRYGKSNTFVGRDIDLGTFVTAVSCNKSIVSVEKNNGTIGSDHFSIPYCDVCSALTCYALNTVGYYATESIGNIPGLNLIGKINDNGVLISADNFKLGDVLNEPGSHTAIVTDIIRDGNGNATVIELCDAAANGLANMSYDDGQIGGVARRKGWTIAEIYDDWGAYDLLRYANIATVPYTMSPYVNVGDEPEMMPVVHYPCLPYEGNNFTYKVGYVPNNAVKVLIMEQGYNYLKVFKDDVEISGSPFAVTSETESIDIAEISAGSYKAYLCNLSDGNVRTMTYPCHWTIVT